MEHSLIRNPRHPWSACVFRDPIRQYVLKTDRLTRGIGAPFRRWLIRREGYILTRLHELGYPYAPRIIERGRSYLKIHYIQGQTLYHLVQDGPMETSLFTDLELAVKELHDFGFAHGEIRLGNVMISQSAIYLIDFTTCVSRKHPLFRTLMRFDLMALEAIRSAYGNMDTNLTHTNAYNDSISRFYKRFVEPAIHFW